MFGDGFLIDIWKDSYTRPVILTSDEKVIETNLKTHVGKLASEIGPRNTSIPQSLESAARYIEKVFSEIGLTSTPQKFQSADGTFARNIEAVIDGSDSSCAPLIIGAHYDSVNCPGANDNASAVAALLEIARAMSKNGQPKRSIHFVAFANEEPPYFGGNDMGSWVYARQLLDKKKEIMGMICLEDIGYYSTVPGSQNLPGALRALYGNDIGNFVAFCGNSESKDFVAIVLNAFRSNCDFPSEGLAAPQEIIPDITLSDNRSFWRAGYKAVMVTDTVFLRYGHYHQPSDTPDKLTYPAFARVTYGLCKGVAALVG